MIHSGELAPGDIATELCLHLDEIHQLVDGKRVMSNAHQLSLAMLVIARVPRLARRGHSLRAQAAAAIAFGLGETEVHQSRPGQWNDSRRRRR